MASPIQDQVPDFFYALFGVIFSDRFKPRISDRLRRDAVIRQKEEAAGAASQSLTRFFVSRQLSAPFIPLFEDGELAEVIRVLERLKSPLDDRGKSTIEEWIRTLQDKNKRMV